MFLPIGARTGDQSGQSPYPWDSSVGGGGRFQQIYDTSHFTSQGLDFPIRIAGLRWRADRWPTTWSGTANAAVTIALSSALLDHAGASQTFASNRGGDFAIVFSGPLQLPAGATTTATTIGPTIAEARFASPFTYDPTRGRDFLVEVSYPAGSWSAGGVARGDARDSGAQSSFVYQPYSDTHPTGIVQAGKGVVIEVFLQGSYANFSATPRAGASPLTVQFASLATTSDPAGIQSWAWDFDDDGIIDSSAANPSHTYSRCGRFGVSLTVTDTINAPATLRRGEYITVDPAALPIADFSAAPLYGAAPLSVQFTDLSQGAPTGWQWDFDNDGVIDSTQRNPSFTYTTPGLFSVRMVAANACGLDSETKPAFINVAGAGANPTPDLLSLQFNEVRGPRTSNSATGSTFPRILDPYPYSSTWQGDPGPGRDQFRPGESGFGCLRQGTNAYVGTGTPFGHAGSLSFLWWFRRQPGAAVALSYIFGDRNMLAHTGAIAGTGFVFRGTLLGDLYMREDTTRSAAWQHLALIIDNVNGRWDWYLDGRPVSYGAFTPGSFSYFGTGVFDIAAAAASSSSRFTAQHDLDDFRVYGRALSYGDVLACMASESLGTSTFDSGCQTWFSPPPTLLAAGPLRIPDPRFEVEVTTYFQHAPVVYLMGFQAHLNGALPIPLNYGAQYVCELGILPMLGVTADSGSGVSRLAIPMLVGPEMDGTHAYLQAFVLYSSTNLVATNVLDLNLQIQ